MKTRNFTLQEVAHRPLPDHLIPNAVAAMQAMQMLRDMGSAYFKKDVPLRITSGYREKEYNRKVSGSRNPDNSYHVWRKEADGTLIWAVDFVPIGVTPSQYFAWMMNIVKGERYRHQRHKFIHFAPNGKDKPPWIQS